MKLRLFALLYLFYAATSHAQNPIIQTKYTADPAPLVYQDTVFLYTGHDEDDAFGFKMQDWLLYTAMIILKDIGVDPVPDPYCPYIDMG